MRIKELDGLRGVAIILVLAYHFLAYGFLHPVFSYGWIGVDLFFVLSGFLITGILLDTKHDDGYYKKFITRRALRIWPLYYGVLFVFYFVSQLSNVTNWFREYQFYFWSHTSNFLILNKGFFRPLGHFWSLAIEEQFYLVWPIVIGFFNKRGVVYISIILLITGILLRAISSNVFITYGLPFAHLDGILIGSIVAIVFKSTRRDLALKNSVVFLLLTGICFVSLLTYGYFANDGLIQKPLSITIISLFFGSVLIASFNIAALSKLLSNRILIFFGKYSYGIYVFNSIFFHYTNWAGADRLAENKKLIVYSCVLIITVAISYFSYNLFEIKFLRLKNKLVPSIA